MASAVTRTCGGSWLPHSKRISRPLCSTTSALVAPISPPTTEPNIRICPDINDVVEIGAELGLKDAVFVGHSVSSMIGVLAARKAPTITGNPDRPEMGQELTNSFCRTDPEIAKAFAR